jgi:hypothetical protein
MSAIPDYIDTLSVAAHLDDRFVGFANQKTDTFKAFETALAQGAAINEHLQWLVKNASGAGKIYAAILIEQFDKEAAKEIYESLKNDTTAVEYRSSDLFEMRTVGDLAAGLLGGESVIAI